MSICVIQLGQVCVCVVVQFGEQHLRNGFLRVSVQKARQPTRVRVCVCARVCVCVCVYVERIASGIGTQSVREVR